MTRNTDLAITANLKKNTHLYARPSRACNNDLLQARALPLAQQAAFYYCNGREKVTSAPNLQPAIKPYSLWLSTCRPQNADYKCPTAENTPGNRIALPASASSCAPTTANPVYHNNELCAVYPVNKPSCSSSSDETADWRIAPWKKIKPHIGLAHAAIPPSTT